MIRLPLQKQIAEAGSNSWPDDLLAGVITAILLVPQGMAYAMLAGLPAEMGLYASIVPPVIYALLGTSRALAVGPVAVAALMVANALTQHYGSDELDKIVVGSMILAAETGIFLLLLGSFRLGALVSFISHPVLSGFTTGAALLIVSSQLKHLSAIDIPRGDAFASLAVFFQNIQQAQPLTLMFGLGALVLLLLARAPLQKLLNNVGVKGKTAMVLGRMAPLAVVILATVVAALFAKNSSLSVVGNIPAGLPIPSLEFFAAEGWIALLPSAVLIALVGYVESVSVAKVLAARRRQKIDANQELIALGASNIAASLAGSMPVAGGFSRSVVNFDAGARTQRAALFTSLIIAIVAVFFTSWFQHLPNAVLAAIIVVAVLQLVDIAGAKAIWAYDKADGAALLSTAIAVLLLGIEAGLLVGIGLSLSLYLWRTSQPHMAVVGQMPDSTNFRNVNRHVVKTLDGVLMVRIDENLYFANAAAVESYLMEHAASGQSAGQPLRHIVLLMSAVSYVDASALDMLGHLEHDFGDAGVTLHLAEVKGPVMDRLLTTKLGRSLAPERVHLSANDAWNALSTEKN